VIGKKIRLFIGQPNAAPRAAIILSLVERCRCLGGAVLPLSQERDRGSWERADSSSGSQALRMAWVRVCGDRKRHAGIGTIICPKTFSSRSSLFPAPFILRDGIAQIIACARRDRKVNPA